MLESLLSLTALSPYVAVHWCWLCCIPRGNFLAAGGLLGEQGHGALCPRVCSSSHNGTCLSWSMQPGIHPSAWEGGLDLVQLAAATKPTLLPAPFHPIPPCSTLPTSFPTLAQALPSPVGFCHSSSMCERAPAFLLAHQLPALSQRALWHFCSSQEWWKMHSSGSFLSQGWAISSLPHI